MSNDARSSFLLQDFESASVRLKRKLRLLLNKSIRKNYNSHEHVTLTHFLFYIVFLMSVWMICQINRSSEDIFNTDRSIRRLLIKTLGLNIVKSVDQFWIYLDRFSRYVHPWTETMLNENVILGFPRLRQLRIDPTHCHVPIELQTESAPCYPPYEKSREDRGTIVITDDDHQYNYTSSKETNAFVLTNIFGPYSTGGFIYTFHPIGHVNDAQLTELKNNQWLNISTRAIFLEFIYYNPNTDLLTSINILFEFLTTGTIETRDFFYTVSLNGYFFGRYKILGVFQILSIIHFVVFVFYFVSKIAEHRLWFLVSSYWNVYDLGLIILFSCSIYFDILFLLTISDVNKSLSALKIDAFKEFLPFIELQLTRNNIQAYLSTAMLIHLLRFLPHCSNLLGNLLNVFYKSIRNSIGFLLLFFLIFMSFVFFATLFYGDDLEEFHTFTLTSYTLIRCALGQFDYDRPYRVSSVWTPIFYMVFVCVVFFILLNLFVAVVNESYVLGVQEQQQIEDDLREEYMRTSNNDGLAGFRRLQRPALQMSVIRCFQCIFRRSFDQTDETSVKTHEDDVSLEEKLRTKLLNDGQEKTVVEKFFERLQSKKINDNDDDDDDDENLFFLNMSEDRAMEILGKEFRIFDNQYKRLAEDWQRTVNEARKNLFANSIDKHETTSVKEHLMKLDENLQRLEILMPKVLKNIVPLYRSHISTH